MISVAIETNYVANVFHFQIGVMANTRGVPLSTSKDTESFGTHPYAPSAPETQMNGAPNFSELFTVTNTHSQAVRTELFVT